MDEEAGDEVDDQHLGLGIEAGGDDLDQRDGQEDGDRIVGAGLDFERGAHAVAQLHIAGAQQEEHRRRVGGGDGRAEQEGFQPAEIGQVEGGHAEQAGGDDDADGGERKRRHGGLAQRRDRRAEAGLEQDDGERQCADEIGEPRIVELDAEPVDRRQPVRGRGRGAAGARRSGRRSGSKTPRRARAPCRPASRDKSTDPFLRMPLRPPFVA